MALKKFVKDPQARLDYIIDWGPWLAPTGDILQSAIYGTVSTGITAEPGIVVSNASTKFWVSGGTAGNSYDVTIRVTTVGGRTDERTITITCKDL